MKGDFVISHIYVDNFRCFTNFQWQPGCFSLLLGDNGRGKTALFDVLEILRDIITRGTETTIALPVSSRTAWDTRREQTFELGISGNGGQYKYRLMVEHAPDDKRNRIRHETLNFDDVCLYEYDGSEAHLHRDNGSDGPTFPFDWSRSAIATIPERNDNMRLTWFRERMERMVVLSPDPVRMNAIGETELEQPDRKLHNLVSWLRHLLQERPDCGSELRASLFNVLEGFADLKLERAGSGQRTLRIFFAFGDSPGKAGGTPFELPFDWLSEGQRNLLALYTVLYGSVDKDTTVCIDEPDNYVSLREIQPWIIALKDKALDTGCQCLLISHHPELINYLAADHGHVLYREESGPARIKLFEPSGEGGASPSEIVARGWE
jgi:predicted ATPase